MKTPDIEDKSLVSNRNKVLWFLLILFGSVTYLAGYYFPPTLEIQNKFVKECPTAIYKELGYNCGEFDSEANPVLAMEADNIVPGNVFVKLEGFPTFKGNKARNAHVTLKMEYSVYEISGDKAPFAKNKQVRSQTTFTCTDQNEISCNPETIAETQVGNADKYIFIIKLLNSKDMLDNQVEDLKLAFVTINSSFESYLTYFKWLLLLFAIAGFVIYKTSFGKMSKDCLSSEQCYVTTMGLILLLFVQPFISHSDLTSKPLYSFFSVIITCGVVAFVSLFWFTLLERLASVTFTISAPSKFAVYAYSFALFSASLATYGFLNSHQEFTTFLDFATIGEEHFDVTVSKYFLYVVLALGGLWSLLRISQIIPKFKELDWRDSTSFTFTFCYVLCYAFFLSTGSLQPINFKGARVVLLYGITTLYTLLLQVMYQPFEHEVEEAEKRRKYDNPAAKGQYGDLDASDIPDGSKTDNIELRGADHIKKGKQDYDGESYGDDI